MRLELTKVIGLIGTVVGEVRVRLGGRLHLLGLIVSARHEGVVGHVLRGGERGSRRPRRDDGAVPGLLGAC